MLFGIQILGPVRRHARVVAMVLVAAIGAAGCGQKGPLYLPSTQPDARPATPYPATLPAATDTLDETPQR